MKCKFSILPAMFKLYLILTVLILVSCEKKETNNEKTVMEETVDSYEALIEKAKGTEALLQKQADSIIRKSDSLGIPGN